MQRKTNPAPSTALDDAAGPPPDRVPDRVLDITREICPMTFVRTRLALDAMAPGSVLLVLLRGDEPRARVPETARALGHEVLDQRDADDGVLHLLLRRGGS